jgi:hypothetical protein
VHGEARPREQRPKLVHAERLLEVPREAGQLLMSASDQGLQPLQDPFLNPDSASLWIMEQLQLSDQTDLMS